MYEFLYIFQLFFKISYEPAINCCTQTAPPLFSKNGTYDDNSRGIFSITLFFHSESSRYIQLWQLSEQFELDTYLTWTCVLEKKKKICFSCNTKNYLQLVSKRYTFTLSAHWKVVQICTKYTGIATNLRLVDTN